MYNYFIVNEASSGSKNNTSQASTELVSNSEELNLNKAASNKHKRFTTAADNLVLDTGGQSSEKPIG